MIAAGSTTCPASFEGGWAPRDYLWDYYRSVQPDEEATLGFLVDAARLIGPVPTVLEVGCGPTVHHALPFAGGVGEIHVADFLDRNLSEVRRWTAEAPGAWDWSPFTTEVLRLELGRGPVPWEVADREAITRRRITRFLPADVRRYPSVAEGRRYPAVVCCFCPDSITDDLDEWRCCTANLAALVALGGWLVLTALGGATSYAVGDVRFPSAGVTENDVASLLAGLGFPADETSVRTVATPDPDDHGFDSVIFAVARKR